VPFLRTAAGLLAITCGAVLVHGYHLGADDAAIYIPAIKQAADPSLYPFGAEFFRTQAGLSLFPKLIGGSARLTHMPVDVAIFLWHITSIYLFLLAAWRLLCACFESVPARWGGVLLLAGCLSAPVAGTALTIMDPYLATRSLSSPCALFAVAEWLLGRRWLALAWLLGTAAIHPQMSFYAAALLGTLELTKQWGALREAAVGGAALAWLPFGYGFQPAQGPAREALLARTYFFVTNWAWYEWIGAIAPTALLAWFGFIRPRGATPAFRRLARALIPYGLAFTAAALVLASSPKLETFNRLQPMRAFHLLYCIFFALLGGLMGEYVLGRKAWRWVALFAPLAAGMWFAQEDAYSSSPHVEWPGNSGRGSWLEAFYWIRQNTPKDAVFALDPNYMAIPGEDQHGFRAVAERSVLADKLKDSGPVALFPQLAEEWKRQVSAQEGWEKFDQRDFERLARTYAVTWIVTRSPGPEFARCPYRNKDLAVCKVFPSYP
jgi:hypothetical protein